MATSSGSADARPQANNSTEQAKQRRAGQVANRFVNRFRATLDFGIAWKAFRMSDPSCTHLANGILDQSDYERLKLNSRIDQHLRSIIGGLSKAHA
jgi:hypothetical protein